MEQTVDQPQLIQIDQPDFHEAWEMVDSQLRMEMTRGLYESWVQPLRPLSFKDGVFRVSAVNVYARDWVETRLRTRITRLLEGLFQRPVSFSITVNGAYKPAPEPAAVASAAVTAGPATAVPAASSSSAAVKSPVVEKNGANGRPKKSQSSPREESSPRKIQLQRAYGSERASVIQPERGMFLTMYFFNNWLPLLGHSAYTAVLAARSLCYWNPMTGELRNVVETDMGELARRAAVSVRTIKDVLNNELVRKYFLRYKVRRVMTPNGVRTAGIILQVRMDDPLTPEDQQAHDLTEEERWYTADFEDEDE
jgi:hypothetical protein